MEASIELFLDQLSENLANLIIVHLEAASISKPLLVLDLFYHYADVYLPLVSYLTDDRLEHGKDSFDLSLHQQKLGPIHLDPAPLAEQMDQLMELEWSQENLSELGRRMVRKTAAILNQSRLQGRIATHELFGAYAADGTVEGHSSDNWEDILTACGMPAEIQAAWKRMGFF